MNTLIYAQEKHDSIIASINEIKHIKITLEALKERPYLYFLEPDLKIVCYSIECDEPLSGRSDEHDNRFSNWIMQRMHLCGGATIKGAVLCKTDNKIYDFAVRFRIYDPVEEAKAKITPDTCKSRYFGKIIERKINEYFNRNFISELLSNNKSLYIVNVETKDSNYISIPIEYNNILSEMERNKLSGFLNKQIELFPHCCCYTQYEEGIKIKFEDTIKRTFFIPTYNTRHKTIIVKDRSPKLNSMSIKNTSVYVSGIDDQEKKQCIRFESVGCNRIPIDDTSNLMGLGYNIFREINSKNFDKNNIQTLKKMNKVVNKWIRKIKKEKYFIGISERINENNPGEIFPDIEIEYKVPNKIEFLYFNRVYNAKKELICVEVYRSYDAYSELGCRDGWFLYINPDNTIFFINKKEYYPLNN